MASWIKGVYHAAPYFDVNSSRRGVKATISVQTSSSDFRLLSELGYKRDYFLDGISYGVHYSAFEIP